MKHQTLDVLASLAIDGKGQKCHGGWVIRWFKHDADASLDAKLQDILLDYGAAGYGLYWYCVELIAKDVTPRNITFELEHDVRVIARNLNLSVKEVENMMQKMIDLGLFDISKNNKLACIKLVYRLDDSTRKGAHIEGIVADFYRENPDLIGKIPNDSGKVRLDIDKEEDKEEEIDIDKKQPSLKRKAKQVATSISDDFKPSEKVISWYADKGFKEPLEEHVSSFILKCQAKGYTYKNWDAALMNAITDDWAKLRKNAPQQQGISQEAWDDVNFLEPTPEEITNGTHLSVLGVRNDTRRTH